MESQKQSYLLKRWNNCNNHKNDNEFELTSNKMYYFGWKYTNTFAYSIVCYLNIDLNTEKPHKYVENTVFKSNWFQGLFARLKGLNCIGYGSHCLLYIPIDLLFGINNNINKNLNNNDNKVEMMDYLAFTQISASKSQYQRTIQFCQRFREYMTSNDKQTDKIRKIKELRCFSSDDAYTYSYGSPENRQNSKLIYKIINEIIETFGLISYEINLGNSRWDAKNKEVIRNVLLYSKFLKNYHLLVVVLLQ